MKKIIFSIFIISTISLANAQNFSGKYDCNGYDSKDGAYSNDIVTLSLVKEHSHPERDLYAYMFNLKDKAGKLLYEGEATSSGNNLAIYFSNVDKKSTTTKNDHGIGIATVGDIISRNGNGKFIHKFNFNKFYFEPAYPSDGSETCTLQ